MILNQLKNNKYLCIFFIYLFIPLNPLIAFEHKDYHIIDRLVNICYRDKKSCNQALSKIHIYQKNAATKKQLSCQTRLLGLEANLIMVMNFNSKRHESKSLIDAVKKYC